MGSYIVQITQIEELDDKVCHDLVQIVSTSEATQRRLVGEVDVDQHEVETSHAKDSIIA